MSFSPEKKIIYCQQKTVFWGENIKKERQKKEDKEHQ
jgi:hypothetical protein